MLLKTASTKGEKEKVSRERKKKYEYTEIVRQFVVPPGTRQAAHLS